MIKKGKAMDVHKGKLKIKEMYNKCGFDCAVVLREITFWYCDYVMTT